MCNRPGRVFAEAYTRIACNRLADLLAVKEKMVTDERAQREALEGKLKRITGEHASANALRRSCS